jgi:ribose/xylose/arabinose/galactoside ABC-type transport system permease subunit
MSCTSNAVPPPSRRMMARVDLGRFFGLRAAGVYYALGLLIAALAVVTAVTGRPNYLSAVNLTNIVYQSSGVAIMGVAMTVVLITGNFDLSVASVAALAAAVQISVVDSAGFVPSVLAALAVAGALGLLNGVMVQFVGINAFIVTLGTLTAVRGLVLIVTNGRSLMVQDPGSLSAMTGFESGHLGRIPYPILYMAAFTLVVGFVLTFTIFGRRIYAVGGNAEAARLSGINVPAYKLGAFVLSSLAAGFAGVLFGCRFGAINPTAMQGDELTVIAAAILGGTSLFGGAGSVVKTLAGALLLFTLTNGFNILDLGANYQGLIEGTVLVVAAAIYTLGGKARLRRPAIAANAAPLTKEAV